MKTTLRHLTPGTVFCPLHMPTAIMTVIATADQHGFVTVSHDGTTLYLGQDEPVLA